MSLNGKSRSLSTIKNHIDNFNPEEYQTVILKRKVIHQDLPCKKLKEFTPNERVSVKSLVHDQKFSLITVASIFNSNSKTISHPANLDDALIERKSRSPLQVVSDEEFKMMTHLIEITHRIVTIELLKTYFDQ